MWGCCLKEGVPHLSLEGLGGVLSEDGGAEWGRAWRGEEREGWA